MIFIRDNCRIFDPTDRISSVNGKDRLESIGIKLIAGIADEMRYIDALGENNMTGQH